MKAVIFDLDGVICTTDKYHYIAWKKMADSIGVYFDETINNRLRGVSRIDSLNIILEKNDKIYSDKEKEELANYKNDYYVSLLNNMSRNDLSSEVKDTLDTLKARGYKMAIGSSSKNTKLILRRLGLDNFFDAISDGTNISKSKPDPEVFLKAAEFLNENPKDCLVVEDAKAGIEAAYRGGFKSAGLGEANEHSYVTYKLNSFKNLLDIME